jgi:hypothetical protein
MRIDYDNGCYYIGEVNDENQADGNGTLFACNREVLYKGEWQDGKKQGYGTFYYTYCIKKEGGLVVHYYSGTRYEGEWRNDKRNGQGTHYFSDGGRYEGQFRNDKMNGRGTLYYPDGSEYDGNWLDNTMNGHGVYYFADGGRYVGEWKDGKKQGVGTLYSLNGTVIYRGEWNRDKKVEIKDKD